MADTPNNITKLLTALCGPIQDVENALQQLLVNRAVDTAVGIQLDVLGKVVGQARGGLTDDQYREFIRARIAANRSGGTPEDLIRVTTLVLGIVTTGHVVIRAVEDATFILEIRDFPVTASTTSKALQSLLTDATAAGVRVVIVYSAVPLANTFRLDGGPGLDQGHLARGIDYASTDP